MVVIEEESRESEEVPELEGSRESSVLAAVRPGVSEEAPPPVSICVRSRRSQSGDQ